jgi:TRAP-type mannitol/chloroaromatic compound transport system permease large subunit
LENIALHPDVKAEWAPNEKVALEAAFGASYAGARERGYGSVSVLNEGQPESKAKTIYYSFSALLTPVIILGGIYSGVFTTTEAAGVAVLYGILVGYFIFKQLSFQKMYQSFVKTGISSAVILLNRSGLGFRLVADHTANTDETYCFYRYLYQESRSCFVICQHRPFNSWSPS